MQSNCTRSKHGRRCALMARGSHGAACDIGLRLLDAASGHGNAQSRSRMCDKRHKTRSFMSRMRCYALAVCANSRTGSQTRFACSHVTAAECVCDRNRNVKYTFYDPIIHYTSCGLYPMSIECRFEAKVTAPGHRHGRVDGACVLCVGTHRDL